MIVCSRQGLLRPASQRARERKIADIAIVRIEQLYPFPHKAFAAEIEAYPNATEVVWCQEEPQNQGAWFCVQHYLLREHAPQARSSATPGAPSSASPAVGYTHLHDEQQKALVEQALRASSSGIRADAWSSRTAAPRTTRQRDAHAHRSQSAAAVRSRSPRRRSLQLAQEGRRCGRARREPDRHRDRQGRARGAGAGGRRAGEDRQGRRRHCHAERGDRARSTPKARKPPRRRCRSEHAAGRSRAPRRAAAAPAAAAARRSSARRDAGRRQADGRATTSTPASVPRHRPRRPRHQGRRAAGAARAARSRAAPQRRAAAPASRAAAAARCPAPPRRSRRASATGPSSACRCRGCARASPSACVQSQSTAAILTTFNEVNMQPVIELRKRYKERFEKEHGVKLGFMRFFVKAAVARAEEVSGRQRVDRRQRHRLSRLLRHRHRGRQPARPGRADPAQRRPDELRRHREEDRRFRQARAGRQAHARGADRRHVLDLATAACSARCCRRRSSIRRSRRSSACTRPRTARWSRTARSSCGR